MDILADFVTRIGREGLTLHGVAVQQHGRLLAAHRWIADTPHVLHSLSKSFTATAVGMAIAEGRMGLHDRVVDYFPALLPKTVSPELEALTVRHLLTMAPGRDEPCMMNEQRPHILEPDWVKYYLSRPFDRMPGQRFSYDTGCTYVLGAIVQQVTGEKLIDYLMPRLFTPLHIYRPMWDECPLGRNVAGAGLFLRTKELLPFGQLYLQKGVYEGQRLVSEEWVREATSLQIENVGRAEGPDGQAGYGYQFWLCHNGAYRAAGAHSQFCIVLEALDAVVAINALEDNSQAVQNAVWEEILPKLEQVF